MIENNVNAIECRGKESFIGDYAIYNCSCYGAYNTILTLEVGCRLHIKFDKESDAIIVVSYDNGCEIIIGELKIPEIDKKVFIPYLKRNWGGILYDCVLSQKNKDASYDEMLRITIWINRFEKCDNQNKTNTQADTTSPQANVVNNNPKDDNGQP